MKETIKTAAKRTIGLKKVAKSKPGLTFIRKGFQSRTEVMRDESGNLLTNMTMRLRLWKNYFDKLLNVCEAPVKGNLNEIHTDYLISVNPTDKEIETAIKKLKKNNATQGKFVN